MDLARALSRSRDRLIDDAAASYRYMEPHLTPPVVVAAAAAIAGVALIEPLLATLHFDTVPIRLAAAAAAVPLLFNLPREPRARTSYWVLLIALSLPLLFGTMLVMDAALTPPDAPANSLFIYEYMVALFLLVQLMFRPRLIFFVWAVASAVVAVQLAFVAQPNWAALAENVLVPMPVYLSILVFGALGNRNVVVFESGRKLAVQGVSWTIAHELRTPLAAIGLFARGIARHLPRLVDGYRQAQAAGLPVQKLRGSQLDSLADAAQNIDDEVRYSNTVIDMLLLNAADHSFDEATFDECAVGDVVDEAVSRFPFNSGAERALVDVDVSQQFAVRAPRILLTHVLFNLLKNALHFAQHGAAHNGTPGRVSITAQPGDQFNVLVVEDTGGGIGAEELEHIFDRFFTTREAGQGVGIGLSFCRSVMAGIGGRIECDSTAGGTTTFRLLFPPVPG